METEKKAPRTVSQSKCEVETNRFGNSVWNDDKKFVIFNIAKRMFKTSPNILGCQHMITMRKEFGNIVKKVFKNKSFNNIDHRS